MSEAVFPLLGPLVVLVVALPATALLAKLLLAILERSTSSVLHASQGVRQALLVGSSLVPLLWFASAALHQAESSRSTTVCGSGHGPDDSCFEAGYFALALTTFIVTPLLPRLWRARRGARPGGDADSDAQAARIGALILRQPGLRMLVGRLELWTNAPTAIATRGSLMPRVVVRTSFAAALDDDALAAALHHEVAHVQSRDPFHYALTAWALSIQPFGQRLLGRELAGWIVARETHCDREAVLAGADPRALAHALVVAARGGADVHAVALAGGAIDVVRLRVELLLAYAEHTPAHCCRKPALAPVLTLLGFASLMPHLAGTQALDLVHVVAEGTVSMLVGS